MEQRAAILHCITTVECRPTATRLSRRHAGFPFCIFKLQHLEQERSHVYCNGTQLVTVEQNLYDIILWKVLELYPL